MQRHSIVITAEENSLPKGACQIMKSPHTKESSPKTIFVWSVERHLYWSDSKWKQGIDAQNRRDDAYMQDLQEVFKNERIYKAHAKRNHLTLPCSMCDKKFGSRRALNNHNKKKHENPTIDPPNFKYSDH